MEPKPPVKRPSSPNPFFPQPATSPMSPVARELRALALAAAAVAIALALFTHSVEDPSWNTWSSSGQIRNWLGRLGSTLSDLMLQGMGLGAFFLPVALGLMARETRRATAPAAGVGPRVGAASLLLSSALLLQALFPARWLPWDLSDPGGVLGRGLLFGFRFVAGTPGAVLLGLTGLAAALILHLGGLPPRALRQFPKWRGASRLLPWLRALFSFLIASAKRAAALAKERIERRRHPVEAIEPAEPRLEPVAEAAETSAQAPGEPSLESAQGEVQAPPAPAPAKRRARMPVANRHFELPQLSLLSGRESRKQKPVDRQWFIEKGNILVEKLRDFGVEGEIVNIAPGPVITVYEFKPASGIKIREIANLSDDLTLALSVLSVRIVAPIPGKPVVGIEIPSPQRETVYFRDIVQETSFYGEDWHIPIALGRLASGEPVLTDLATMPHLLVAGATGTGKSVFVNTLICSLLYRFAPQQLKLILVDPKMVELSHYDGIPHLLLPVVVDSRKAVLALRWLVDEMERRYRMMHQFGVRHLDAYNARLNELQKEGLSTEEPFLPYIVTVIDEYADLMAVVPKEVELSVARLAQKARASGIHLVLATQRPSTDVVTGTIKANFPSRISFRVASSVDSKTILDRTGADRLLGQGDLLFHSAGFSSLKRMQGSFIPDADIEKVVSHLKRQGPPEYDEAILADPDEDPIGADGDGPTEGGDGQLYDAAVRLIAERGEASISLLQRHLRIGYNRAASLMEQLEREGVVGQSTGTSKRRPVLVNPI